MLFEGIIWGYNGFLGILQNIKGFEGMSKGFKGILRGFWGVRDFNEF